MNENGGSELKNSSDQELKEELERRVENKWEKCGEEMEKKVDRAMNKLPVPINALFDALCIGVIILAGAWVFTKFGWIDAMPTWTTLGIIAGIIFILSLVYRWLIKPRCSGLCCKK